MTSKRTLRRWLASEKADRQRILAERDRWKGDFHTERAARRITARVAAEADATVVRLTGRADRLRVLLDAAMDGRTDGEYTRLTRRLERMTLAHAALRESLSLRPPVPEGWRAERSRLLRELELSERARRSLDDQVDILQRANDSLSRDAVTASGLLTIPAEGREPGIEVTA